MSTNFWLLTAGLLAALILVRHIIVFLELYSLRLNLDCEIDVHESETLSIPLDFMVDPIAFTLNIDELDSLGFKRIAEIRLTGLTRNSETILLCFEHPVDNTLGLLTLARGFIQQSGEQHVIQWIISVEFVTELMNEVTNSVCTSNCDDNLPLAWAARARNVFFPHVKNLFRLYQLHKAILLRDHFSASQIATPYLEKFQRDFAEFVRLVVLRDELEAKVRLGVFRKISENVYGHNIYGALLSTLALAPPNHYLAKWLKQMRGYALEKQLTPWIS